MRLAVPDLVSNSYFPAIAAVELGLMHAEGIDMHLELRFPVTEAARALRDGEIDFLAGAAHAPLHAFPNWRGVKLLAALSRNMYWFLVVRSDLSVEVGDVSALRNLRIGVAPGPDLGLLRLLKSAGVSLAEAGLEVGPVPGVEGQGVSFGVTAAEALAAGRVDAFWANGLGAEVAVRSGAGKVIVDARRDGGDAALFTFSALATTEAMIEREPQTVSAAVRAIVKAQELLRESPDLATKVGERLFPPMEAGLIAKLIERDAPFYRPAIDESMVTALNAFARDSGLLIGDPAYGDVVATGFASLST